MLTTKWRWAPMLAAAVIAAIATDTRAATVTTGDGLLSVTTEMPSQIRVGEEFKYTVQVSNASDEIALHEVKLKQKASNGLSIDSIKEKGQSDDQSDSSSSDDESDKSNSNSDDKNKSDSQSGDQSDSGDINIKMLKPGESKSYEVTATADEEGEVRSCLEVASYKPAVCTTARAVKPQLELVKVAPKKANRCNVIVLQYTLKNGGSGDVGSITITDSLGDGLATVKGENELKFDVSGLDAGETRKFEADVFATKPGEFSSRATAKADNSDLKSRSKETTTNVVAAELTAEVEGPSRVYGDQLATFTAMVTNSGNAPADDVRVEVMWPEKANLADMSDVSMKQGDSDSNKSNSNSQGSNQQPTAATAANSGNSGSDNGSQGSSDSDSSMKMTSDTLTIDRLEPGQTAKFEYAVRPGNLEEIPTKIKATYVCTVDAAEDTAEAKSRTTATAQADTKIVRLPALQLMAVDKADPVNVGEEIEYVVKIWNEGDAPDQNVQLTVSLPDGLKFVSVDGPTEAESQEDTKVTFAAIDKMEAGDEVTYTLTAKGKSEGSTKLQAELESKMLQSAAVAEEPTRVFKR